MRSATLVCIFSTAIAGCAGDRIVEYSQNLGVDLGGLATQEVVLNLENTIDSRYHIPSRTTFGKGTVNTTDTESLGITIPVHNIARNSGSVNANFGQYVDQFSMNVAPTTEGSALLKLRELYGWAVYGERTRYLPQALNRCGKWLYWQQLNVSGSSAAVPPDAVSIAKGRKYELLTTNQKCFSDFVLTTFGAFEPAMVASPARQSRDVASQKTQRPRSSMPSPNGIPQRTPAVEPFSVGPSILLSPPAGGTAR